VRTVRSVLADLESSGVVSVRGPDDCAYQLGRAADSIPIAHVLEALRGRSLSSARELHNDPAVRALIGEVNHSVDATLHGRTLADLAAELPPVERAR
jgi:DNA-binding IscR family transcriptional regulator